MPGSMMGNTLRKLTSPSLVTTCAYIAILSLYFLFVPSSKLRSRNNTSRINASRYDILELYRADNDTAVQVEDPIACGAANIGVMKYVGRTSGSQINYQLSVHDPEVDAVVSRLILEGDGTYGTVNEVHAVCESELGLMSCTPGKQFMEVGSALGHVSMYLATRGMRGVSIDPLKVNLERLKESLCLNGVNHCAAKGLKGAQQRCRDSREWGSYSADRVQMFAALVGNERDDTITTVFSEPHNLAATLGGKGSYSSNATTWSIQDIARDTKVQGEIELLFLTCQGCEARAVEGASHLIRSRRVKNIIWRVHSPQQVPSAVNNSVWTAQFLMEHGFSFFNIEECRKNPDALPYHINNSSIIEYVSQNRQEHPDLLATLAAPSMAWEQQTRDAVPV